MNLGFIALLMFVGVMVVALVLALCAGLRLPRDRRNICVGLLLVGLGFLMVPICWWLSLGRGMSAWVLAVVASTAYCAFLLLVTLRLQRESRFAKTAWVAWFLVRWPILSVMWLLVLDLGCGLAASLDPTSIDYVGRLLAGAPVLFFAGWVAGTAGLLAWRWPFAAARAQTARWLAAGILAAGWVALAWPAARQFGRNARAELATSRAMGALNSQANKYSYAAATNLEWSLLLFAAGGFPLAYANLAEFPSSGDPRHEIVFVERGRGGLEADSPRLAIYAKGGDGRLVHLFSSLEYNDPSHLAFACAQWTVDGQAAIFTFDGVKGAQVLIGYDFLDARTTPLPPRFQGDFIDDIVMESWMPDLVASRADVEYLAKDYGGLDAHAVIHLEDVMAREQPLLYWKEPAPL